MIRQMLCFNPSVAELFVTIFHSFKARIPASNDKQICMKNYASPILKIWID